MGGGAGSGGGGGITHPNAPLARPTASRRLVEPPSTCSPTFSPSIPRLSRTRPLRPTPHAPRPTPAPPARSADLDADQIIRADLLELWRHDLQGAVYGFTPFCTSRKETLGYQFWRSGYWADHLKEKQYHISALFLVDLQRFRLTAAGDTLRAIYDQLSRDPNSLSNLDQDLPNYAQNILEIHSLPQEWLYCESWCDDASKAAAKTIDLCNNPRFKEPKLDMARRIINGPLFNKSWVELDHEVELIEAAASGRAPPPQPTLVPWKPMPTPTPEPATPTPRVAAAAAGKPKAPAGGKAAGAKKGGGAAGGKPAAASPKASKRPKAAPAAAAKAAPPAAEAAGGGEEREL